MMLDLEIIDQHLLQELLRQVDQLQVEVQVLLQVEALAQHQEVVDT